MIAVTDLQAGDVLLYAPKGIYGFLIRLHTWHPIGHVEVYDGDGQSWASRDGQGVDRYPLRLEQLATVLRPIPPIDLAAGRAWARRMIGTRYGWLDLLQFVGADLDTKGIVCSPFAARFYQACGCDLFNGECPEKIAPFQFALSPLLRKVWPTAVSAEEAAA